MTSAAPDRPGSQARFATLYHRAGAALLTVMHMITPGIAASLTPTELRRRERRTARQNHVSAVARLRAASGRLHLPHLHLPTLHLPHPHLPRHH